MLEIPHTTEKTPESTKRDGEIKQQSFAFKEDTEMNLWRYFETRNMVFKVFAAHPVRINIEGWGRGQAFRPAFLAHDLPAVENKLSKISVRYSKDSSEFGRRLEMVGLDHIRMSFIESPEVEMDWKHPLIGASN